MNNHNTPQNLIHELNEIIVPFTINDKSSYQPLLDEIGDSRIVLMGEATHGTHEFYQARMELTKLLISEKNFHAIAIEGDWPSAYPIHKYIQGKTKENAEEALIEFKRFPAWMWRNSLMVPFLEWLQAYNVVKDPKQKIGFYGLDLYSLHDSIKAVLDYLKTHDAKAAEHAVRRYSCFDAKLADDPQTYGYLVESGLKKACIKEVTEQLLEMRHIAFEQLKKDNLEEEENLFYATQNARVVKNAEHYYRAMFESRDITWNIRDQHMGETLQNLIAHLETKLNTPAKIIIWAHNSHVGDARATEMSARGETNIGQIVRENFSTTSYHIGFSTYTGTVTAADNWGDEAEVMDVLPGMKGSYEALFHELKLKNFILFLRDGASHPLYLLSPSRLQRAIGVMYKPATEYESHYYFARLVDQFDALIHIDETKALR
jgi:erythromycin esterase-like protein